PRRSRVAEARVAPGDRVLQDPRGSLPALAPDGGGEARRDRHLLGGEPREGGGPGGAVARPRPEDLPAVDGGRGEAPGNGGPRRRGRRFGVSWLRRHGALGDGRGGARRKGLDLR